MRKKPFIVANVMDALKQYMNGGITASKMTEILNEISFKWHRERNLKPGEDLEQKRRDLTEIYINTHCGNYTDKEKTIARNSIQIGWEIMKKFKITTDGKGKNMIVD